MEISRQVAFSLKQALTDLISQKGVRGPKVWVHRRQSVLPSEAYASLTVIMSVLRAVPLFKGMAPSHPCRTQLKCHLSKRPSCTHLKNTCSGILSPHHFSFLTAFAINDWGGGGT